MVNYSEVQLTTFRDRYAWGDERYPHEAWQRVAAAVALREAPDQVDYWTARFFDLQDKERYVPGGRIMAAMGTGTGVTAQNCYVIPSPHDSRKGIMESLTQWIEIQSKGGGVGVNLSSLRPAGARVEGVNGTSSGPVNWAQLFAFVTSDIIIQGGSRRGAAMIMLDVSHPDVFSFIHAKEVPGKLEGCNMSVCISDAFMEAVATDKSWDLVFDGKVYETVKARQIWNEVCEAAWKSAEPGIYFMDRANKEANSGYFETLVATNPCGEQPLGPYGACLLGSFNLKAFMKDGDNGRYFDWNEFIYFIPDAVRFNDNVVDLSSYPLPECAQSQQDIRRMGLGIMGLADVLIELKLRYGSKEAIDFTEQVFSVLKNTAYWASAKLSSERGPFPKFSKEFLARPFVQTLQPHVREAIEAHGIRNCYLLTQAPTGTTAQLVGVNSGIEPYFAFKTFRKDRLGSYWVMTEWAEEYESDSRPAYLVTADEVTPEEHVLMQAAAQRHNDSSISKTANLPESATVEDVKRLYDLAYQAGLKSLSVYRNNSRSVQVLNRAEDVEKTTVDVVAVQTTPSPMRRKLPQDRQAVTHKFMVGDQEGYLTIGLFDDGSPGEVFTRVSKQGSTVSGLMDTVSLLLSYCLQYGVPLDVLVEKITGTSFEPAGRTTTKGVPYAQSIPDYMLRWMDFKFLGGSTSTRADLAQEVTGTTTGEICSRCGSMMRRQEGCVGCPGCGWEKCG